MADIPQAIDARDPSWSERVRSMLPADIQHRRIAIIGCGSVGSFMASELARAGVSRFLLIDPDIVEWPNLSRTVYGFRDVGQPKVEALARHLLTIFPDIQAECRQVRIQEIGQDLPAMMADVSLAVSAVDDPAANGMLDRYLYALGIKTVFVGLYKGAQGGEVVVIDPVRTPCFSCATGGMRNSLAGTTDAALVTRDRDYGTNRLVAEIALGCDIHFVCSAAVKVAFSLLGGAPQGSPLERFIDDPLENGVHYIMFGMQPDYFVFRATHANAIGQHAYQSLWLKTTRNPECPRCGEPQYRESPL